MVRNQLIFITSIYTQKGRKIHMNWHSTGNFLFVFYLAIIEFIEVKPNQLYENDDNTFMKMNVNVMCKTVPKLN